jgi:hypothetical protein
MYFYLMNIKVEHQLNDTFQYLVDCGKYSVNQNEDYLDEVIIYGLTVMTKIEMGHTKEDDLYNINRLLIISPKRLIQKN